MNSINEKTSLGNILDLSLDKTPINPEQTYKFAGIYSFGKGLFESGYIEGTNTSYKYFNKLKRNHIVISKVKGWEGAIALVDQEFEGYYVSPQYPTFTTICKEDNIEFIYYYLSQKKVWKELLDKSQGIGARRNSISEEKFLSLEIPYTPPIKQKKIVEMINFIKSRKQKVDELIDQQIQDLDNLVYSLFTRFENEYSRVHLYDICNIQKGSFQIMKTPPGEFPLVITGAGRKSADSYDFDCEAVCIPLVSSTGHGNAAMHRVHYENGKFALSNLLCALTAKGTDLVSLKFLYHLFMVKKDEYFVPLMKGTANVSLNPEKIGNVLIPLPRYEEQLETLALIDKLDMIRLEKMTIKNELGNLLPSTINKAFKVEM